MSLQIWLPLNRNLNNNGVLDTSISLSGSPTYTDGKIGLALTFASQQLIIPNLFVGLNKFSFAFWVRNNTSSDWSDIITFSGSLLRLEIHGTGTKLTWYNNNTSYGSLFASGTSITSSTTQTTWNHIAITFDNGIAKFYFNGNLINTNTSATTFTSDCTSIYFGSRVNTSYSAISLNDIRLYDHCLSLAEIKELSKGLILHYSFNDRTDEPTINENSTSAWEAFTSYWIIDEKTSTGLKLHRTSETASRTLALKNSTLLSKMKVGDTWTFSCYLYADGQPYKSSQQQISTYGYNELSTESRSDGYFRVTFTVTALDAWIIHAIIFDVAATAQCELRYMQFEKNDHATAYTSSSRTNTFVTNETGIGYDGTQNNITYTSDSASGSLSCKFNGSTSGISIPYIKNNLVASDYTLAFWIYPTTTNRDTIFGDYQTTGAVGVNIERRATTGNLRIYYGADIFTESSSIQGISMPLNTWTHMAVTYNSSSNVFTIYKNGIKAPVSYTKDISSFTKSSGIFWIGRDNRATSPEALEGNLSDFRFYSTCLSQTDIEDLYQTKASISKLGDVLSSEFLEAQSEFSVSKKYIVNTEDIEEIDIPSSYQRLSYIQSNGTLYIDTEFYSTPKSKFCAEILFDNTAGVSDYSSAAFMGVSGDMLINFGGSSGLEKLLFIWLNTYNNDSSRITSIHHSAINEKTYYELDAKNNTYIVGNLRGTVATSKTTNGTYSLKLFGSTNSSGVNKPFAYYPMRIYNCKLYDDNKLVRHFIPTKRISDNVLGLYDIVTNTFYVNKGTGSFTTSAQSSNFLVQIYKNNTLQCRYINEV